MIRSDVEHARAVARVRDEQARIETMRRELATRGMSAAERKRVLDPVTSFHRQLVEEIEAYERLQSGEFPALVNLNGLGDLLVALRIHRGLSQRQLAELLGSHESQVSRDERNDYHGITVARASRILEVLGASVSSQVVAVRS